MHRTIEALINGNFLLSIDSCVCAHFVRQNAIPFDMIVAALHTRTPKYSPKSKINKNRTNRTEREAADKTTQDKTNYIQYAHIKIVQFGLGLFLIIRLQFVFVCCCCWVFFIHFSEPICTMCFVFFNVENGSMCAVERAQTSLLSRHRLVKLIWLRWATFNNHYTFTCAHR